ncbi:MAG TPA: site-specific integrase [Chitinophagaceae bacterium]|nr:site-specific integrase [Chitinophagaceae bacterium]
MEARLSILFYGKKTKLDSNKTLSVYLRVTINGERFEVSTQRYVESGKWSTSAGKVKGNSELEERKHTLVEVFTYHNEQMKALIGKSCSKATHRKYRTTLDHTIAFLEWKFKRSDIEISNIGYSFITDFEFWLKSIQNCNHNTTIKYLSNLRKIIYVCLKNGWLIRDPFFGFKMTKKEVIREILTKEELQTLISKEIQNTRIRQVRDIFIFSCFTGLAYIDAKRLKRSEIVIGMDGERWIYTQRKKTDSPTKIPLLPVVLEIMEVYKDQPGLNDSLLPVPSNSKLNAYLKEVADICGINKHLTFHIARHTFATIVTLNNGVPIESVSKMLGHKSIKTTQIYAKILDRKVSEDMGLLRKKFAAKNEENNLRAAK